MEMLEVCHNEKLELVCLLQKHVHLFANADSVLMHAAVTWTCAKDAMDHGVLCKGSDGSSHGSTERPIPQSLRAKSPGGQPDLAKAGSSGGTVWRSDSTPHQAAWHNRAAEPSNLGDEEEIGGGKGEG
jgi:hypothetical protein